MYFVYALQSKKDGNLYIGFTSDIERRIKEHNAGKNISTRNRRPFDLIYKEAVGDRIEARKREKYLKSGSGRELLKSLVLPL